MLVAASWVVQNARGIASERRSTGVDRKVEWLLRKSFLHLGDIVERNGYVAGGSDTSGSILILNTSAIDRVVWI